MFTRGTTEASTSSPRAGVGARLRPGDEILITAMEHHSNIVPWQLVCEQTGAVLRAVPITDSRRAGPGGVRAPARRSHQARRRRPRLQRAGHDEPGARAGRARTRVGGAGAGGWRPVRAAPARSTSPTWAATSSPSPGTRCSVPPASACCTAGPSVLEAMPPWQGGGDMIETGCARGQHLGRAAGPIRGGHAADRGRCWGWRPRSTTSRRSVWIASRPGRRSSCAWPPSGSARFGECA